LKALYLVLSLCLLSTRITAKEVEIIITRTDHPPSIDGNLDDPAWSGVVPVTGFMQYNPVEGIAPSESTELYIAYDRDNFYLAFRCYDSHAREIRATMTQRESWENDDCVGFAFDTFNSEREAFLFNLNPYGIPSDFIWHHDGYCDNGWDSDLRSKGRILHDCYCIEVAVPFKSLRMPAKDEQVWGFYALRSIKHKGEFLVWPPRTHKIPNLLVQAALLRGIRGIQTGNHFALLPYLFSSATKTREEKNASIDAGLDFRYGIASNLMLDVTVNPDYSQIEADPDRIDLTERYAQTLPEKRPFFTEGIDIFASNQWLFYSRNIVKPIAGLKLTGKVGKNRIGFLSAVDAEVRSSKRDYYNHLRLRREILDESAIGVVITNKDDFQDGTSNRTFSLDGVFRFEDVYSLKSQLTGTFTRNTDGCRSAVGYNANLERFGATSYTSIWYNDFPEDFEAQSGAMWELVGYREIGAHNGLFIRKALESIDIFELHGGLKGRLNYENALVEDYFWASAEASLNKVWTKLEFFKNHELCAGQDFRYSGFEYELWNTPAPYIEHYLSALWGDAIHYATLRTGWRYRLLYNFTIKPMPKAIWNTSISREDFYRKYGAERLELQTLVRTKVSYQILPAMFLRAIYQYTSEERISDASVLFAFEYSPLSNIYIGANFKEFSCLEDLGNNVEIFSKIGYLWRF
jgi:hypothetical protein